MTQNTNIQEALKMIDNHDWYWMMSDYNYEAHYNAAKADMKEFVRLVASIDNASIRETLRALWTLAFENARDAINGRRNDTTDKKAELMNALALAA